ncbi:MAG TPA: hypothetical protein VJB57_08235 [Dehalococcoidia bacterium]|nr:hypothetical protein [Dehalococcoidia bacterium]
MTTVVAAFCPWTTDATSAQGVAIVADCRLTAETRPGEYATISDEAQKVFQLGKFVIAGYAGHKPSGRYALERLRLALPKDVKPAAGYRTYGRMTQALYKGGIEAKRSAKSLRDRLACGPFGVLVAWVDDRDQLNVMVHKGTQSPTEVILHGELRNQHGMPKLLVMGSGIQGANDLYSTLLQHTAELASDWDLNSTPVGRQAGLLGLALLDVLESKKLPFSGGGVQTMTVDSQAGSQAWLLKSSSLEYADNPFADPNSVLHGPARFTQ